MVVSDYLSLTANYRPSDFLATSADLILLDVAKVNQVVDHLGKRIH